LATNSQDQLASEQRASVLPALNISCQPSEHKGFKFVGKKVNCKSIKALQIPDIPSFSTLSCYHVTSLRVSCATALNFQSQTYSKEN